MRMETIEKSGRFWRGLNALALVCLATGSSFVAGALLSVQGALPEASAISAYRPTATTKVWSTELQADGSVKHTLLARVSRENREPVALKDVPLQVQRATVAIEDRRFWDHKGVDPRRILKAALVNVESKEYRQGASTISQQLVRNVWLTREKTILRKLKEALLAIELERKFSKQEILEMYLNQVYYGRGAYGIETAARLYYGKSVKDLTLDEAAVLAGLPQRPRDLCPFDHPRAAKQRRNLVLDWMVACGWATREEAEKAKQEPLQAKLAKPREEGQAVLRAPYFTNLVLRRLCDRYGSDVIWSGGLNVYTTLDIRLQKAAEQALNKHVERRRRSGQLDRRYGQAALVTVQNNTGRVLAMVGGYGKYSQNQFNRAHNSRGRQCGSAFKPYLYAAAMESGWTPDHRINGSAYSVKDGRRWHTIDNYSPRQGGTYRLWDALALSVNGAAARLIMRVGIKKTQRYGARIMNLPRERLRPVPTLCLGTSEVTPLEMASGYTVFATGGLRYDRTLVDKITDSEGKTLWEHKPRPVRVLEEPTGITMIKMLRYVVTNGTGRGARRLGFPCGGKTGTTNNGCDAWWIGFTPELCTAVWMGNDNNKPMRHATGSGFCLPLWRDYMKQAMKVAQTWPGYTAQFVTGEGVKHGRPPTAPPAEEQPVKVLICAETGMLAGPYCPVKVEREYANESLAPHERCTAHMAPRASEPSGERSSGPIPEPPPEVVPPPAPVDVEPPPIVLPPETEPLPPEPVPEPPPPPPEPAPTPSPPLPPEPLD